MKKHTFIVEVEFEDNINLDFEIAEIGINILNCLVNECDSGNGLAPDNSETFTKSIKVINNNINSTFENVLHEDSKTNYNKGLNGYNNKGMLYEEVKREGDKEAIHESKDSTKVVEFINIDLLSTIIQNLLINCNVHKLYYDEFGNIVAEDLWGDLWT